jgi:hypothetical protein
MKEMKDVIEGCNPMNYFEQSFFLLENNSWDVAL